MLGSFIRLPWCLLQKVGQVRTSSFKISKSLQTWFDFNQLFRARFKTWPLNDDEASVIWLTLTILCKLSRSPWNWFPDSSSTVDQLIVLYSEETYLLLLLFTTTDYQTTTRDFWFNELWNSHRIEVHVELNTPKIFTYFCHFEMIKCQHNGLIIFPEFSQFQ